MNKGITRIVMAYVVVICTACTRTAATPEPLPGFDIPVKNINSFIQLDDSPELANTHKNGDLLSFRLTNLSDQQIVFPGDFAVRVLMRPDGQNWIAIQNNSFEGNDLHYLPTRSSSPLGLIVDTLPYVPGLSSAIKIRVLIVGHVETVDGEEVGAYLDVALNP